MKRLMTLRLRTHGCAAEAAMNGLLMATVAEPGGSTALPVHEFLLRGLNRLILRVDPASVDTGGLAPPVAELELRLGRTGTRGSVPDGDGTSGTAGAPASPEPGELILARASWGAVAPGERIEVDADGAPTSPGDGTAAWHRRVDIDLPIDFPRWRWIDAPPVAAASMDAMRARALQCVRQRILELRRGDAAGWLGLTRLALEDRALAYGGDVRAREVAFLETLRAAPDGRPWSWTWPQDEDFVLRPEADGRLLSCLGRGGGPALAARSRDARHAWALPLRLAWIDDRLHGLR